MSPSPPPVNRFFISPQYSLFYRRVKQLDGAHQARSDYAVILVLDGRLKFRIGEKSGSMLPDQALLLSPSIGGSLAGQSVELLQLTLAPALVVDHAVRMHLTGPGTAVAFRLDLVEHDERLAQLARSMTTELTDEKPGREIVLDALVEQVVVHLLRHYSNIRRSEELELSRVGLIDRRIRRSVELMHAQLEQDLSLKEIAAASYLSPFHFVRVFKKLTGTTPHAYLASIRTSRAQLLLAEPNLSVTEISSRVGYSSPSHFTKAFRQATGLNPRAFRKALISS
ncbi:MAG: helix-turn-helix transcriptional regulator [Pyrinomonadaceae bacterium]|nr:helix-turn-helix transcriptional regulator [Pyrinomonadaceae bacterium]MBA3572507.1 helix-turn-helix transcriptional regulator [Pyrinomonadaceae bacterium]MDQ3173986.1 AraC family transcriptional regulator [Acidobacteriota bacterium]